MSASFDFASLRSGRTDMGGLRRMEKRQRAPYAQGERGWNVAIIPADTRPVITGMECRHHPRDARPVITGMECRHHPRRRSTRHSRESGNPDDIPAKTTCPSRESMSSRKRGRESGHSLPSFRPNPWRPVWRRHVESHSTDLATRESSDLERFVQRERCRQWIPAFAGMTVCERPREGRGGQPRRHDGLTPAASPYDEDLPSPFVLSVAKRSRRTPSPSAWLGRVVFRDRLPAAPGTLG